MRVYTYSEARRRLSELLDRANTEEVVIRRRGGDSYTVKARRESGKSPFDVPGLKKMKTKATVQDIVDAVRESRERDYEWADRLNRDKS